MKELRSDIERYQQFLGNSEPISTFAFIRGCFSPRMLPVVFIRLAEFFTNRHLRFLGKFFTLTNVVLFGIEVSPQVRIGGGLFLPHTVGTVLGAERIGQNVTIQQGVTLGTAEPDNGFTASLRPVIGNHVFLGAGAKVIGRVSVGDHAKVGANAVVLQDVPPYAIAVGIPARIILRSASHSGQEQDGV